MTFNKSYANSMSGATNGKNNNYMISGNTSNANVAKEL